MREFINIVETLSTQYKHLVLGEDNGSYQNFDFTNGVEGFGTINRKKKMIVIAYIRADQKKSGVGRAAVAEVETLAKSEGISIIGGDALQGSEGFWEKMGFAIRFGKDRSKRAAIRKVVDLSESTHARNTYEWNGKMVVAQMGEYRIVVNDVDDATFVTAWSEDNRRVGELTTTRFLGAADYQCIQNVEVDPRVRGQGIGKAMYQALLDNLGPRWKGIASIEENRINNRQVPAILKSLGGYQDGEFVKVDRK